MKLDAVELAAFYQGDLGERTRRIILRRLRQIWPQVTGQRLLGYGFATPYLKIFQPQADRVIAAMPAEMGVIGWPPGKSLATLAEEDALPFPDAFFDRILVVHGLEGAQALRPLLRQLWRVLAPEGRLLIVAPNRASLWAQVQRSPFGYGRPFSRGELDAILQGALFVPEQWSHALHAPPLASRALFGRGLSWERFGARFLPGLGGVHLVEAGKSLYAPAAVAVAPVSPRAARLSAAGTE